MGDIEELNLSVRAYNCLKRAGIDTVEQLTAMTPERLYIVRNLGRKQIEEVLTAMKSHGLKFKEE